VTGANQVRQDRRNRHEEGIRAEGRHDPGGIPAQIQEALGELVGAAREGLLALSVGVGLGVVHELMELEVVRHEALSDRAGCETSPPGCRRSLAKLGAV
jgi:hypothetical protein